MLHNCQIKLQSSKSHFFPFPNLPNREQSREICTLVAIDVLERRPLVVLYNAITVTRRCRTVTCPEQQPSSFVVGISLGANSEITTLGAYKKSAGYSLQAVPGTELLWSSRRVKLRNL